MISTNVSDSEPLSLKTHYVAVHKAPKYGAKVPTNANYSLSDIICRNHMIDFAQGVNSNDLNVMIRTSFLKVQYSSPSN